MENKKYLDELHKIFSDLRADVNKICDDLTSRVDALENEFKNLEDKK